MCASLGIYRAYIERAASADLPGSWHRVAVVLRLFGILITVLGAIAVTVLTWPQFFRLERELPIAQIVSFRGLLALGLVALVVVFFILGAFRRLRAFSLSVALVLLIGAGVNVAVLIDRGLGADSLPDKSEASVRVMTWNTAGEATSAQTIAQTAVAMEADIVTLPETPIEMGEAVAVAMRDLGNPMWAHHTQYGEWDSESTTILISPDLGDYSVIESSVDGTSNTSTLPSAVAMPNSGRGPIVVAAHAVAPREDYMAAWRADLQWLADQCVDGNVIMAGDFNATLDHMAALGIDGADLGHCSDAATATGNGGVGTWPTELPALVGAPIDHVMTTDAWTASGSIVLDSLDNAGSDHRPVVVQLEPNL